MKNKLDARPSPIAGRWYPSDAHQLSQIIDQYLNQSELQLLEGKVLGVIAPHAGLTYSGAVAGYAFATLEAMSPDLVVILSPMHHPYHQALITTAHTAYETPLGVLPVDVEVLADLNGHLNQLLGYEISAVRFDEEHSLEMELPFLQRAIKREFNILPIMVRDQSIKVIQSLGQALYETVEGRDVILVASTDLSHFYPQDVAAELDQEMLRRFISMDEQSIMNSEREGRGYACGRGAVSAMIVAAKGLGATRLQVLRYATSGDVTQDYSQVVGYAAAVVTKQ